MDAIRALVERFVICGTAEQIALTLWIALTWFEKAAQAAPILNLQSPEKRRGKSTLLSVIMKLVKRPLPASSISAASMFRVIEEYQPTLVIDEADAFLNANEEARGIIFGPYTRCGICNQVRGRSPKACDILDVGL